MQHLKQIHEAEDKFINDAKKKGIKGIIASNLIKLKKYGEENNIIDSKRFSGFGLNKRKEVKDPTLRLKLIARKQNHEQQKGGLIPAALIPVGIGILGSLGGKIIGDLYDLVKKKVTGTGYEHKMKHKTIYEKRIFLNHILNKY